MEGWKLAPSYELGGSLEDQKANFRPVLVKVLCKKKNPIGLPTIPL